jgi:hypothetical protein
MCCCYRRLRRCQRPLRVCRADEAVHVCILVELRDCVGNRNIFRSTIRCRLVVLLRFVCSCDRCAALLGGRVIRSSGVTARHISTSKKLEENVTRGTMPFNTCRVAAFAMALWSRRGLMLEGGGSGSELESFNPHRGMGPPLHLLYHQGTMLAGRRQSAGRPGEPILL